MSEPTREPIRPGGNRDAERESVLARLPWILAMEAAVLAVLVYPLRLQESWGRPLLNRLGGYFEGFLADEIEPLIQFYTSPLVLKGALGGMCAIALIAVMLAGMFLSNGNRAARIDGESKFLKLPAYAFVVLFLAWSAVSAAWSPTRALSVSGLPWLLAIGAMAYALLRRGIETESRRQFAALLLILGAIASAISIAQASPQLSPYVFKIMLRFDDSEGRNLFGSVLGHNTAAGSFIFLTSFPALAFALGAARGRWTRVLAAGYFGLAFIAMLVTQSRAVWIFGVVLVPLFIFFAVRTSVRRMPAPVVPILLAIAALGVASQVIRAPWNPLYVREKPVGQRFEDLKPESLQDEARLRLLICSLPLVAERPLMGWGLSSFQYVYPKAQADYFATHPDTELAYTTRRSHMAHNEYLQVAVESGLIGLGLLLLALGEVFWRGFRHNRAVPAGERLLHAAFGFSGLAVALHALVDFPFHLPQLVIPWILCMASFGSPRSESASMEVAEAPREPEHDSGFRPLEVARLVGAFFAISLIPLAAYPLAKAVRADADFNLGQSRLETVRQQAAAMPFRDRSRLLQQAFFDLRNAMKYQPHHERIRHALSEAHYFQAALLYEADQAAGLSTPNVAAIKEVESAIDLMNESMERYLRFHDSFYMMALYHYQLARMLPPPANAEAERSYVENLRMTAYFAPSHIYALKNLAEWMARQPNPDIDRVVALRRLVYEYSPYYFFETYELKINELIELRDFETAAATGEAVLQAAPGSPEPYKATIWAHLLAGKPDNRRRVLELAHRFRTLPVDQEDYAIHPYWGSFAGLCEAIVLKQWARAEGELDHHAAETPRVRAMLFAVEDYAREKQGRRGMPTRYTRPEPILAPAWHAMILEEKAKAFYRIFDEPARALETFEARLQINGPAPPAEFWIDYAALASDLGEAEKLEAALNELRGISPRHSMLHKLSAGQ